MFALNNNSANNFDLMKYFLLTISFLFIFFNISLIAQVVRTDPPFPNVDMELTITLQTEFGNQGLKDCACEVYLHTGVITDQSANESDWKYVQGEWGKVIPELKMTATGANTYTFTFTPRSFYNMPVNENAERLAFVFRNADGSKAARSTDGSDIFIDLFPPSGKYSPCWNNLQKMFSWSLKDNK